MSRPPQHSIDANPSLILPDDPAWDHDRIERELQALAEVDRKDHTWVRYLSGESRFDLRAQLGEHSPADYLQPEAVPVEFRIRRLSVMELADITDMYRREILRGDAASFLSTWAKAVRMGLSEIRGPGAPDLTFARGILSESSLAVVHDNFGGFAALTRIGSAIWEVSQPLSYSEKKV